MIAAWRRAKIRLCRIRVAMRRFFHTWLVTASHEEKYDKEERKMAYVIGDGCISCGSCAGACPVGAISEGDGKYEINPDTCIDCGTCAGGCPVGVISEG